MDTNRKFRAARRWFGGTAALLFVLCGHTALAGGKGVESDLDIVGFTATDIVKVNINPPEIITLTLTVQNYGSSTQPRQVLIEGRRIHGNGKVFNHPFVVEAEPGGDPVVYEMVLEDFAPQAGGIDWVATLKETKPDAGDVAYATTRTIPELPPSKGGKDKVKVK